MTKIKIQTENYFLEATISKFEGEEKKLIPINKITDIDFLGNFIRISYYNRGDERMVAMKYESEEEALKDWRKLLKIKR